MYTSDTSQSLQCGNMTLMSIMKSDEQNISTIEEAHKAFITLLKNVDFLKMPEGHN